MNSVAVRKYISDITPYIRSYIHLVLSNHFWIPEIDKSLSYE